MTIGMSTLLFDQLSFSGQTIGTINKATITARKEILITEIQNLQDRLTELDKEKSTLIGNINAMRGALQQCDYFIGVLGEEETIEEKEDE